MTRLRVALNSLNLLCLLCLPGLLASPAFAERPTIVLKESPAPVLDGKLDDEAWKGAAEFELSRSGDSHGKGKLLRSGRMLYIGFESEFVPIALGCRFHVTDPQTNRRIALLVSPFDLPQPPVSLWLERKGGSERLDASRCQLQFHFDGVKGFSFEAAIPLESFEVGRPKKRYLFDVELWDTSVRKPMSYYPMVQAGGRATKSFAYLDADPDWGVDVADDPSEKNTALELLAKLAAVTPGATATDTIDSYTGQRDGLRNQLALAELEQLILAQLKISPGYVSLRAQLIRVVAALNRPEDAFGLMEAMRKEFPFLVADQRQAMIEVQMLRDAGLFARALKHLEDRRELLSRFFRLELDLQILRSLVRDQKNEELYRKQDAARDDCARVKLETSAGDIVLELFDDDAPNAVANFVTLVSTGFYDGTRFHWVTAGSAVYGGDPNSRDDDRFNDGFGDPGYHIEPEPSRRLNLPFSVAFVDNRREARSQGCTFTINIRPAPQFDGSTSVFGRVIKGFDVVRKLSAGDKIKSATILRKRKHDYKVVKRP